MSVLHFLDNGFNTAAFNMACDEFLFRHSTGTRLCVYGWNPPAISLGHGQDADKELDIPVLKAHGIDCVKRLTGGRAVLHDKEITYSITGDIGGVFGENLHTTYEVIGLALQHALGVLGVEAELEKGNPRDTRSKTGASLPCFASTARHELKVLGKKIIGSAQRRDRGRFLQHGSLIFEQAHDITDFLKLSNEEKAAYRAVLKNESLTLAEASGKTFSWDKLARAFQEGFSEKLKLKAEPGVLGDSGKDSINALLSRYCF